MQKSLSGNKFYKSRNSYKQIYVSLMKTQKWGYYSQKALLRRRIGIENLRGVKEDIDHKIEIEVVRNIANIWEQFWQNFKDKGTMMP